MRGQRVLLATAVAIAAIGAIGVGVVSGSDNNTDSEPTAARVVVTTTSTTQPIQVLGVVVDNTTTTVAVTVTTTTTTGAPAASSTTAAVAAATGGRIWGYSYATTGDDDKTTVTLRRGDAVVAERRTDADGLFDFRDLPAGAYTLQRTTETRSCTTTTTAGAEPTCSRASSRAEGPDVNLERGQDYRVDVF